jgi:hypothetical protein
MSDFDSQLHRFGPGSSGNMKYISVDGHHEAVFNNGRLVGGINRGTYNYIGPFGLGGRLAHGVIDVLPFAILGH